MLCYCLKSRKNTESKNSKFVKTKNGRMIILSNYVVCNSKKSRFIKEQEASGLLSGPNSPLRKTNEIIKNFLLAGEKFMPKMHLREPRFTYSACGHFAKNKAQCKNLKKQEIQNIFIKMSYIKLAFNMTLLMKILKIYLVEQSQIQ